MGVSENKGVLLKGSLNGYYEGTNKGSINGLGFRDSENKGYL